MNYLDINKINKVNDYQISSLENRYKRIINTNTNSGKKTSLLSLYKGNKITTLDKYIIKDCFKTVVISLVFSLYSFKLLGHIYLNFKIIDTNEIKYKVNKNKFIKASMLYNSFIFGSACLYSYIKYLRIEEANRFM